MDIEGLGAALMTRLYASYSERLAGRYGIDVSGECSCGFELLARAAAKRGFLIAGGEYDLERMAITVLDEFRAGKLGRITLESVEFRD
jgi:ribosome biogenesis GTPase A